jgi:hypothetical protein
MAKSLRIMMRLAKEEEGEMGLLITSTLIPQVPTQRLG